MKLDTAFLRHIKKDADLCLERLKIMVVSTRVSKKDDPVLESAIKDIAKVCGGLEALEKSVKEKDEKQD